MHRAIAMVETSTVTSGMLAADLILKTAAVDVIEAKVVCPGKYIILFSGELSAVKASRDAACKAYAPHIVDSFLLGNPHEKIFDAMLGAVPVDEMKALGIIETYSAASAVTAADTAAKTALVELIELRLAVGMCGKSYLLFTGSVAAAEAAVERVKQELKESAMLLDCAVIANPDKDLAKSIF